MPNLARACPLLLLLAVAPGTAAAQQAAAAAAPPEVQQLVELLRKPEVQAWLDEGAPPAAAPGTEQVAADSSRNLSRDFRLWVAGIRAHMVAVRDNAGRLPAEIARVGRDTAAEIRGQSLWEILLFASGLLVLGYGIQRAFWSVTRGWRKQVLAMPLDTVGQRLAVVGLRFGYSLLWIASFAVGSLGALLLFAWPPMLKTILGAVFVTVAVTLLWGVMARFLLSPNHARLRVLPVDDAPARHWSRWSAVLLSWFFGGWVAIQVLRDFDVERDVRLPLAYGLGLVLFALALVAIWRRPAMALMDERRRDRARNVSVALSLLFGILWLLWVVGATSLFWLAAAAVALPAGVRIVDRSVDNLLTPPGTPETVGPPSVLAAALERGARAVLIVAVIWLLAWAWGIDLDTIAAGETAATRFIRGLLNAVVILLVADFAWHVLRTVIDRRIHASGAGDVAADPAEVSRRARLRTLLPILRNILFIVLLVMAALMALSALGVQIAPLIAGAGVVGVAVGFGSQTLVKDVISGVFFLLDDAFRVGEYIVSGSYKGTVESFSLRSIKLRHHRGSLYTVPFGILGAVQNMSRDWVIDKQMITVPFDTDLDLVKKIVKQIGKELLADPDIGPDIIETLKMQGVDAVSELGMQVRLKMMTKPTKQFVPRRRAYAMLKKAFAENGISFAMPTVNVAGGDPGAAASRTMRRQTAAEAA